MRAFALGLLLVAAAILPGCVQSENDGDGLQPDAENRGWVVRVTETDGTVRTYEVTSDPKKADTDGDGLNDFDEFAVSSDPRNIDTDGDRLADGGILCPEAGTELAQAVLDKNILEHPERPGCYLGEKRWEHKGISIATDPTSAHSDSGVGIDDGLSDAEEIIGWNVTVGGNTYHVVSNPSIGSADSDGDGLHDGNEKRLGTDPQKPDTDEDGVNDQLDAAPLGNLVLVVTIESMNLKRNKALTGGAQLEVRVETGELVANKGPQRISQGNNQLGLEVRLDVPDTATRFHELGYGADQWDQEVRISFFHNGQGGNDPIDVRQGNDAHVLPLKYSMATDSWTGGAPGGLSSGPDADVRVDIDIVVE